MKFFIYTVYDPEVESFDSRLNLGPLDPKEMGEQYRRAHIKMKDQEKAFMEGKKAICVGVFDDETGKIEQPQFVEIYSFVTTKERPASQDEGEKEDQPRV